MPSSGLKRRPRLSPLSYAVLVHGKRSLRRFSLLTVFQRPRLHSALRQRKAAEQGIFGNGIYQQVLGKFWNVKGDKRRVRGNTVRGVSKQLGAALRKRLSTGCKEEELVAQGNTSLTRGHLQCLYQSCWLNDEVVNAYIQLLREQTLARKQKSYFHSTFFYAKLVEKGRYTYDNVRRWTSRGPGKCRLLEQERVYFPLNLLNEHWCLAVAFIKEKSIVYLDSLTTCGLPILKTLLRYLKDEAKDKLGESLDTTQWKLIDM